MIAHIYIHMQHASIRWHMLHTTYYMHTHAACKHLVHNLFIVIHAMLTHEEGQGEEQQEGSSRKRGEGGA